MDSPDIGDGTRATLIGQLQTALQTIEAEAFPPSQPFVLPTDTTLCHKLDAAREYQKAGDWDQTVKLLQTVLEAREDTFFRQPYTDGAGKPAERRASTRAEAERLVAALPDEGKKLYDLNFNPVARKWLADARAANDLAALNDVGVATATPAPAQRRSACSAPCTLTAAASTSPPPAINGCRNSCRPRKRRR